MTIISDELKQAMPFTTKYPELGTGPIDVSPLIDPDLFELEREKIFRKTWLYVARAKELPEPGDYKIRQLAVASTSIIIVRDKSGKINAFHNICSHRGRALVCRGRLRGTRHFSASCRTLAVRPSGGRRRPRVSLGARGVN